MLLGKEEDEEEEHDENQLLNEMLASVGPGDAQTAARSTLR